MYISGIRISNFKGYRESAPVTFEPGINVIVGKNNVGKTALLQALSLKHPAAPHRSLRTLPTESASLSSISRVGVTVSIAKDELVDMLLKSPDHSDRALRLPLPAKDDPTWRELRLKPYDDAAANKFCEWFFSHDKYTFSLRREAHGGSDYWYAVPDTYCLPKFSRSSGRDGNVGGY